MSILLGTNTEFVIYFLCGNMVEELKKLDRCQVKTDLHRALIECSDRGLQVTCKWLAEIKLSLKDVNVDVSNIGLSSESLVGPDRDNYDMAKILLDMKEYDRSAFFSGNSKNPKMLFLHLYAQFHSIEKKTLDSMTEVSSRRLNLIVSGPGTSFNSGMPLRVNDGYILYLHGVVLKRLKIRQQAVDRLVQSLHMEPLNWSAWLELSHLITDRGMLADLKLPDHWMKNFFLGHMYLELQMNEEALEIYEFLQLNGFSRNSYVLAQIALAYHNRREVDTAVEMFRQLTQDDPYRLENMDTYSNLLYVKEMRAELSHLAHHVTEVDKYRAETCCVIGNFYSLRSEHQKAVQSFQRALRLRPSFLSAWTLMGHEYMELKNINAAMRCYRQAIEVDRLDYRAWYGLGQAYEILKMPQFSQYHYKKAQALRPNDSRMLIALGEANEKVNKPFDALKCYYKARNVGDTERTALLKLAKLYEGLSKRSHAASVYLEYVAETQRMMGSESMLSTFLPKKKLRLYYVPLLKKEDKKMVEDSAVEQPQGSVRSAVPARLQVGSSECSPESATPSANQETVPATVDASARSDMSLTDSEDTHMVLSP
ncbi:hypothetical protein B566_EDAN012685 [Ephemera danica]|nr:hypothetical protein B566_EDAN012685 [Ephemera danica]